MPVSGQEFERWMQLLLKESQGINARLDVLNGRVRTAEKDIAVLQDRQPEHPRVKQISIGSALVALGTALAEGVHWWLSRSSL